MRKLLPFASFCLTMTINAYAFDIVGTIPYTITTYTKPAEKQITLLKVQLSPAEQAYFANYNPDKDKAIRFSTNEIIPTSINLGMNTVPVLDQGVHGACVTFANTAAIDAIMSKGDYVSQLCSLELGNYLKSMGQIPYSGWEGSYGSLVLSLLFKYGIVNKTQQSAGACAGVTQYPTRNASNIGKMFPPQQYQAISENISTTLSWRKMLTPNQRLGYDYNYNYSGETSLQNVKQSLAAAKQSGIGASRITFGTLLVLNNRLLRDCTAGACGTYHKRNDTWAFTKQIQNALSAKDTIKAGHEMIIVGYDDNAQFIDRNGGVQKGLLILRNSWGSYIGDNGNFYMTYDFFKRYVTELQIVNKNS